MRNMILSALLLVAPALPADSARVVEREIGCPVCGNIFYTQLDVPDPDYEVRLDLKPIGAIPGPWKLPECPRCGFVIYSAEIRGGELERARAAAASEAYRKAAGRSTYHKAAVLYGLLGKPDYLLANTWLKASWQEEHDPALHREDLERSLARFSACAAACRAEERENSLLLKGEILRRLGRFEEALAHLEPLREADGFKGNFFGDMVDYELKLCRARDSSAREMVEVRVEKLPFFRRLRWKSKRLLLDSWAGLRGLFGDGR